MIRIDEIYEGVFLPWLQTNRPGTRMFYYSPFGTTAVENLRCSELSLAREHNYIFFCDQEPINMERLTPTFEEFSRRDLNRRGQVTDSTMPILVTSEYNSKPVANLCSKFGFQSRYYFFHGWAALDWYRGYNYSMRIIPPDERRITHTFICPNRIIGGERWHRTILMYHMVKKGLQHNHISFPLTCPVENVSAYDVAEQYHHIYSDLTYTLSSKTKLPLEFEGEQGSPMTSYYLDRFKECNESLLYLVTETIIRSDCVHLTEKTFKPIAHGMPFILLAPPGSLEYLKKYGFQTFSPFIDETYDTEENVFTRIELIIKELSRLDKMTRKQKQSLFQDMIPIVQHNYEHFYGGNFESVLRDELETMLHTL